MKPCQEPSYSYSEQRKPWERWERMQEETLREAIGDELFELLSPQDQGVKVVMIADSCHSGTVARFAPIVTPPTIKGKGAPLSTGRWYPSCGRTFPLTTKRRKTQRSMCFPMIGDFSSTDTFELDRD